MAQNSTTRGGGATPFTIDEGYKHGPLLRFCEAEGIVLTADMRGKTASLLAEWLNRVLANRTVGRVDAGAEITPAMWSAGRRAVNGPAEMIRTAPSFETASAHADRIPEAVWKAMSALASRSAAPTPAGVDLRPGLLAAIDIVEAEFQGVNIFTDAYLQRMRAIKALRARIAEQPMSTDAQITDLEKGLEEARAAHLNAWSLFKRERARLVGLVDAIIERIITEVIRPGVPEMRECSEVAEELRRYAPKLATTLSGEQGWAASAGPVAEPAVVVDLGHGRWTIDLGTHQGHVALFFEPAPAAGPPMTPAPAFLPPGLVQPGTVCLRFDVPEAMTFLRWWLAYVQDPANTPTDPAEFAAAKMFRAFPAEHEDRQDASALSRALAIHDALPDEFRPADNTPLRNCLPGIWPTVGDLRATLAAPMSAALQDVIAERESQIANGCVAPPQGVRDFFIQGIACGLAEVERLDRLGWQTVEESE